MEESAHGSTVGPAPPHEPMVWPIGSAVVVGIPSGQDDNQASWVTETADLDEFAGGTVNIRFKFDSRDQFFNDNPGWFIDDVIVAWGDRSVEFSDLETNYHTSPHFDSDRRLKFHHMVWTHQVTDNGNSVCGHAELPPSVSGDDAGDFSAVSVGELLDGDTECEDGPNGGTLTGVLSTTLEELGHNDLGHIEPGGTSAIPMASTMSSTSLPSNAAYGPRTQISMGIGG